MGFTKFFAAALVAAMGAIGIASPSAAEPVKIRIAWIAAPANLAPILFAKEGIARHQGTSYVLEPIRFRGSPQQITAIASGELDIADLAYSSFAIAVVNGRMDDLRAIADDFQGNVPGYYIDAFLVRKDSPIHRIEDLKGKVLATNGIGGAIDIALRASLLAHHMEDKRDYTIIEAPLPSMKAMLADKKVVLIPAAVPFVYDPGLQAISRPLFQQSDYVGITQTLLWAARTEFLKKYRPQLVDFFEDVIRARRWYLDPANHDEAVAISANFTKQPASFYAGWAFTHKDTYRDPNDLPNLQAMQSNINLEHKLGFIKHTIDVKHYSDLSIVKEAGARLH